MAFDRPVEDLLRNAACVELDDRTAGAIKQACNAQRDWGSVIREAELHGLAPWLHMRINDAGAEVPEDIRRKLAALKFRHGNAIRIRTRALLEITAQLDCHDIDVLVLKGAALAHLIYEHPGLRPMSDVDLLVRPDDLDRAAQLVSELGYSTVEGHATPADHHHLPTISRTIDGLRISIELHHDALAPDNIGSIRVDTLTEPARAFQVDQATLYTLGHIDTLRHLCRHALEPRETMKLGSALDILLYASTYADDIDWARLQSRFPEVITMLQLLGYLLPLPARLRPFVPAAAATAPQGVGVGMIPLSRLRRRRDRAARLLNPSDWWLRGFYNVPPGRSLAYTKVVRHPARLIFWLWRRKGRTGR
jgi:hypothetical protein